jgi:hypothetical protein
MEKQTATEWLIEQIENGKIEIIYSDKIHSIKCIPEIIEQAKAMHKQQIMDAYESYPSCPMGAEEFYNETYGK